ncbi:hypothetical protein [Clostridium sp.]
MYEKNTQLKRPSNIIGRNYLDINGDFGTQLDAFADKINRCWSGIY